MIKFNYILNDLALSILITKCLHSENANYSDKEELENQIKLIQQENKQLKDNWNNLKKIAKMHSGIKQKCYNGGLWFEIDSLLDKMQEMEKNYGNVEDNT